MQLTVTVHDAISPALKRAVKQFENRKPILEAMGLFVVSWSTRAFNDASLRPAVWAPRQDKSKTHPLLKMSGTLWRSIKPDEPTNNSITISSHTAYSAIHQLGGQTRPHVIKFKHKKALFWPGAKHPVKSVNHPGSKIPARPFMPFLGNGGGARMMPAAREELEVLVHDKVLSMLG